MPELILSDDARRVLVHIRKMIYFDALHGIDTSNGTIQLSPYRLEYVHLNQGKPNYRLYKRDELIGIVRIHGVSKLEEKQQQLAVYLAGIGFSPRTVRIIHDGAVTPLDASSNRLPYLFPKEEAEEDKAGGGNKGDEDDF